MKKILFTVFALYMFTASVAKATEADFKTQFIKNYNPSFEQEAFVSKLTNGYKQNISIVTEIIEENWLDDCEQSIQSDERVHVDAVIYYILRTGGKGYTRNQIKKFDEQYCLHHCIVKIDDKFYYGISKINLKKITKNTKIAIYHTSKYLNQSEIKKYAKLQDKYHLNSNTMNEICMDTNKFKTTTKYVEQAINENLYDDYVKVFRTPKVYTNYPYYKYFKQQYPLMKKLIGTNRFNYEEINKYAFKGGELNIIEIDGEYYDNIKDVPPQILTNAKAIEPYPKNKYQSIKKLKEYKEFQSEYNLDENAMLHVWRDTKKLKTNKKLIKKALEDNSYQDYYSYSNDGCYKYKAGYYKTRYVPSNYFKHNYKTYLSLENSGLSEENRKIILNTYGKPAFCVNPKYWGQKDKKVNKVLKNKNLSQEKKYELIKEKINYRRPTSIELRDDMLDRFILLTSGPWFWMFLAIRESSGDVFIRLKF